MDDRAVVMKICPTCHGSGINPKPKEVSPTPQPRAIVALSDDRQWLVILRPDPENYMWLVYRFHPLTLELIPQRPAIKDTGQDAHEVLAAWLEGRGQ